MNTDELRALLTSGIEAARNNNPILAREAFRQVLREDPDNELAWMWLAQVVDLDDQRREALQNVLRINPNNDRAKDALRRLGDTVPDSSSTPSRLSQARMSAENAAAQPPPSTSQSQQQVFVPKKTDRQNQPSELWAANKRGNTSGGSNRTLYMLTIALAGIILIIVGLVLLIAQLDADAPLTTTETPTLAVAEIDDEPVATNTPGPTSTPLIILETATPPASPEPTQVPSATPAPTETPVPPPPGNELTLLFVSNSTLFSVRGDGSNERDFDLEAGDEGATSTASIGTAALSVDGETLVYSAVVNGIQELYTASANGNNPQRLTNLNADQTIDPTWSPDGQYIAFASNEGGNLDIYIVSANGGVPKQITATQDNESQPVWSPNGKYLAYTVSPTDLESEIYVVELRDDINSISQPLVTESVNGEACQITRAARSSSAPAWSPDGSMIAFLSNRESQDENDVYIMNADGTGARLISSNDGKSQEQSVSWSPDGRWLAVASTRNAAVINQSGFDSASGDSSGVSDDATPTSVSDTATDTPPDADTGDGTDTEGDAQEEATPVPPPTSTPVPSITDGAETSLWLYDVNARLWYQVTDTTATNVFWQPLSNSEIEVVDEISFNCAK